VGGVSWVPLHARDVFETEGFTHFSDRRRRLELFLAEYGGDLTADGLLEVLQRRLRANIDAMRVTARSGDVAYERMLEHGVDRRLVRALEELDDVWVKGAVDRAPYALAKMAHRCRTKCGRCGC